MAYEKQTWVDGVTPLDAEHLNHMEDGIAEADKAIGQLSDEIANIPSGNDGVGIESVVQTTTSTEDGGTNVVTVTKTDGTSSTFQVKNGSKGAKGEKGDKGDTGDTGDTGAQGPKGDTGAAGADGKSAYAYAVEGGYTGTETEFANKLAAGALLVTVTDNNGTLTANKNYYEILMAIVAGTTVIVEYDGVYLPLIGIADSLFFGVIMCDETSVGTNILEITQNDEVNDISAIIQELPNPNALTFTGAVTGSYDGSSAMTVNIPSAVTDDHINSLIDAKLGVIENGAY